MHHGKSFVPASFFKVLIDHLSEGDVLKIWWWWRENNRDVVVAGGGGRGHSCCQDIPGIRLQYIG